MSTQAVSAADLREWVRYPTSLETNCWLGVEENASVWMAKVKDISVGGFGLIHSRELAPGTVFYMRMKCDNLLLSDVLQAGVVHARLEGTGIWLMGCQFYLELDDAEKRAIS
jgi:hypothetical protein